MAKKTGEQNELNNEIAENTEKNLVKKVKPAAKKKRKTKKVSRNKPLKQKANPIGLINKKYITHTGEKLSILQGRFVDLYIELGNQRQAVIQAGYKVKNPDAEACRLLRIPKISDEINWRLQEAHKSSIATAEEIMEFYTKVMRGEEKDQFGLDAPLSERIKAGNELAKRKIDIPNKMEANLTKAGLGQATITLSLDFTGMEDEEEVYEEGVSEQSDS